MAFARTNPTNVHPPIPCSCYKHYMFLDGTHSVLIHLSVRCHATKSNDYRPNAVELLLLIAHAQVSPLVTIVAEVATPAEKYERKSKSVNI